MSTITKEQLIEDLKASTQNSSGMFEIGEDTICALMSMLTNAAQQLPQPAPISVPEVVGWEDVPEEITEDDIALASAWAHGFNHCRAAMLQGAKQWIPCSERMPEEEQGRVIGWNAETREVGEYFYDSDEVKCFSYYNFCGYHSFNSDVVTHWMPLPSSPQKESGNG